MASWPRSRQPQFPALGHHWVTNDEVPRIHVKREGLFYPLIQGERGGSAYGIRTRDLRLERAVSLATRRMRHAWQIGAYRAWLGIEDSNLGLQIQSLSSYH